MTRRYWQRPTLLQALDVDRVAEDRQYMHDPLTPVSPLPLILSNSASQFLASKVRGRGSGDSRTNQRAMYSMDHGNGWGEERLRRRNRRTRSPSLLRVYAWNAAECLRHRSLGCLCQTGDRPELNRSLDDFRPPLAGVQPKGSPYSTGSSPSAALVCCCMMGATGPALGGQ